MTRLGAAFVLLLLPNLVLDDRLMMRASERFVNAFRPTWARIPDEDRQIINDFLVRSPGSVHLCFAMDFGTHPDEPWGRCTLRETRIIFTFLAPFIEHAKPLEAVNTVIAHELAHCHNHANGTWNADSEIEEQNVHRLTALWGFDKNPSYDLKWKHAVDEWRKHRRFEFGTATERQMLGKS